MAQRTKVRREFITRDANGNITTVSDDLAVHILKTGAVIAAGSGTIAVSSTDVLDVPHPGRLAVGHRVFIVDSTGVASGVSFEITVITVTAGVWKITLNDDTGTGGSYSVNDKLVVDPARSTGTGIGSPYCEIRKDDMGTYNFGAADMLNSVAPNSTTGVPTDALIVETPPLDGSTTGVMEFWTPEASVDLWLVKQSDSTVLGYILDAESGSKRAAHNTDYYGAVTVAATDSWTQIQAAILAAESSNGELRRVHIPGGTYEVSQPLVVSQPEVMVTMDEGTIIKAHSSWAAAAIPLFDLQANDVTMQGGELQAAAGELCIQIAGQRAHITGVECSTGDRGIVFLSASDRAWITGCYIHAMTGEGIYGKGCDYISIDNNQFIGNLQSHIRFDHNSGGVDAFQLAITNNKIKGSASSGGIYLDGDVASTIDINDVIIEGNQIDAVTSNGIYAQDLKYLTIANNSIANCSSSGMVIDGVITGSVYNNHVRNNGTRGILVTGAFANNVDIAVQNNQVYLNTSEGIKVSFCTGGIVSGNISRDNLASNDFYLLNNFTNGSFIGNNSTVGGVNLEAGIVIEQGHNTEH